MGKIFISYSRRDVETVDHVVEKMESEGLGIWIDREAIKAGDLWRTQIVQAIDSCTVFVLMLSSNSAASDNVRKEIDLAQDSGRKLLVMKLDEVSLPANIRYQLAGLQYIDLHLLGFDRAVRQLIETLKEHSKPSDEPLVRQAELVFERIDRTETGVTQQKRALDLVSSLTETPQAQLDVTKVANGTHVFIDMPAAAAFELKTRALNQDLRLKQFGIKSLRLNGDNKYVNVSLGILSATATIGMLQSLWVNIPSLFPSLFGMTAGKIIVVTCAIVVTAAAGITVSKTVIHALQSTSTPTAGNDNSIPNTGPETSSPILQQLVTEIPPSASSQTITHIDGSLPAVTTTPTRSSTPTLTPSRTSPPTITLTTPPGESKPPASPGFTLNTGGTITPTNTSRPADSPTPTYTPTPTNTPIPTDTPTDTPTPPSFYFTDAFEPGAGRIYSLENGQVSTIYTRPSGQIYFLALAPDATLYFSNANAFDLYKLENGTESLVYTHTTYLRDVAFDSQGQLYFSEATGSGGDGMIYRLDGSQATLFYVVQLSEVGFWSGTFAFDSNDNLWLSSGNLSGASIYEVVEGIAQRVFTASGEAIEGFFFDADGNIIYADWANRVYRLTIPDYQRSEIYVFPSAQHLSDVASVQP